MIARQRTVAIVRELRRISGARARQRMPRPIPPVQIERSYFNAIRYVADDARDFFAVEEPEILRLLAEERRERGIDGDEDEARADDDRGRRAGKLVDRAAKRAVEAFRPRDLENVARKHGERADKHARQQLDKQVRAAMGVPLGAIEKPIRSQIEGWAALNVDLITTIPKRYHDSLRMDIMKAFNRGMRPETLAKRLAKDHDIALEDAMRIARDQIGKLTGEVSRARQEAIGCSQFVWRTMNDERVRGSHSRLEGQQFDWNELPENEDGEEIEPGSEIQCRCYAEPVLDDLVDASE